MSDWLVDSCKHVVFEKQWYCVVQPIHKRQQSEDRQSELVTAATPLTIFMPWQEKEQKRQHQLQGRYFIQAHEIKRRRDNYGYSQRRNEGTHLHFRSDIFL